MELSASRLAINAVLIAIVMTVDWLRDREIFRPWFESRPVWFRWAAYNTAVLVIGLLGVFTEKEFIYFQF